MLRGEFVLHSSMFWTVYYAHPGLLGEHFLGDVVVFPEPLDLFRKQFCMVIFGCIVVHR